MKKSLFALFIVFALVLSLYIPGARAYAKFQGGEGSFLDVDFFGKTHTIRLTRVDNSRYINSRDRSCTFIVSGKTKTVELYETKRVDEVGITVLNVFRENDVDLCEFSIAGQVMYYKMVRNLPSDQPVPDTSSQKAQSTTKPEPPEQNTNVEQSSVQPNITPQDQPNLSEEEGLNEQAVQQTDTQHAADDTKAPRVVSTKKHSFSAWIKSIFSKLF